MGKAFDYNMSDRKDLPIRIFHSLKKIFYSLFLTALISCLYVRVSQAALTPLEISEREEKGAEAIPKKTWLKTFNASRENFAKIYGTRFAFVFNYAQQMILNSKHDEGRSRGLWYWNLEVTQALWPGGSLIAEFEVDKNKGIDKFLPTFSQFNTNTGENVSLYIPELYMEQGLFKDKIYMAAGKLDLSGWFDTNEVANSGDTQFLSDALVGSETIPFPHKGIGAMIRFQPYDWIYFQSGASTAKATATKIGLSNAFNSTFFVNEFGLNPKFGSLRGNYRFILRLNHQKLNLINDEDEGTKNNDFGFAISFDQAITKHIILFMRYGFADHKVREIAYFWSVGCQIIELIPGRKFDCLGIGVARSIMGDDYRTANEPDVARVETMYEVYYSYHLNDVMALTPNIQIAINPNADKTAATAVVCGVRFLLCF